MHNRPGLELGRFEITKGPAMAAADRIHIKIEGKGGHAAAPHAVNDPIVAACQLVTALQTVASRNVNPLDSIVVSVTALNAGANALRVADHLLAEQDALVPAAAGDALLALLPAGEVDVLEECGHAFVREQADALAVLMLDFIREVSDV